MNAHDMTHGQLLRLLHYVAQAGSVRRFHTRHVVQDQTVGAHSHGVAVLCAALCNWQPSAALLLAALLHDAAEAETGDLPAPVKRLLGNDAFDRMERDVLTTVGLPHDTHAVLTADERRTLKIADCLDGMLYCAQERRLGNETLRVVFDRYRAYLADMDLTLFERSFVTTMEMAYDHPSAITE